MRYFVCLLVMGLLTPVWAVDYNESVAAISYNPSRLGAYSHLKAVQKATFAGGVDASNAKEVNIMSKGTVIIANGTDSCKTSNANCHTVEEIIPMVQESSTCSSLSDHCNSTANDDFGTTLIVENNAVVQGLSNAIAAANFPTLSETNLGKINIGSGYTGAKVIVRGGTVAAEDGSVFVKNITLGTGTNAGQLKEITAQNLVLHDSKTLEIDNFKLGNTDIAGCTGSSMKWVDRVDDYASRAKILACQ